NFAEDSASGRAEGSPARRAEVAARETRTSCPKRRHTRKRRWCGTALQSAEGPSQSCCRSRRRLKRNPSDVDHCIGLVVEHGIQPGQRGHARSLEASRRGPSRAAKRTAIANRGWGAALKRKRRRAGVALHFGGGSCSQGL